MLLKSKLLILLFVLFFYAVSYADPEIYTFYGKVGVRISWDHTKDAEFDHYQLELRRLGADGQVVETFSYITTETSYTVIRPRAGTYEVRVRAANRHENGLLYSEWCYSINVNCAKRRDGTVGDWKLRWKLFSPLLLGTD